MKRFCVLLPFFAVNVLAANLAEYRKAVINTNCQLEETMDYHYHDKERLDNSFRSYLNGDAEMVKLVFMFVAPATAIDENSEIQRAQLDKYIKYHKEMQKKIANDLGSPVPTCYNGGYFIYGKARSLLGLGRCKCGSVHIDKCGLEELQKERIELTNTFVEKWLEDVSIGQRAYFSDCKRICQLRGLYRSILNPKTYVTKVDVVGDKSDKCRLTSIEDEEVTIDCWENI